ncbi:MAG: hypothetical protein AAFU85_03270 [Planctomycetota bacterium]
MLEIFAFPYFVVSGVIGWAIFAPFFHINEFDSLSRAKVATSDLLAVSLPVSFVFLSSNWIMPLGIQSPWVQALVLVLALAFAATALIAGLFLVPKEFRVTSLKRMAIVGVISPFGILLTVGWVGLPVWACLHSIAYLIPSMVAIATATLGLRMLGLWVCQVK